jgi:TRAP-type C4-dicarboxylate transport system permease small subunit
MPFFKGGKISGKWSWKWFLLDFILYLQREMYMKKIMGKIMKLLSWVLAIMLVLTVIIVILQIIWRYIFRDPLNWSDQLCRFLYVWIVMLGIPIIFHYKSVTAFDFFTDKMSKQVQQYLDAFMCLLAMFFAVSFFIFSYQFIEKKGSLPIPGFGNLPYTMIYLSMPICSILLFTEMLSQFLETITLMIKKKEERKL